MTVYYMTVDEAIEELRSAREVVGGEAPLITADKLYVIAFRPGDGYVTAVPLPLDVHFGGKDHKALASPTRRAVTGG
jgi:hypothetical protein